MLQTIIAILIFAYAMVNYKRGLIVYLALQIVWFKDAQLINIPGLASINIDLVMDIAFMLLYIIKKKKLKPKLSRVQFPLTVPFIILGVSWILTSLSSYTNFTGEIVRAVGNICVKLLFIAMLWYVIEDHKDFVALFKYITIIFFVACIYSLIEYTTQSNLVFDYKLSLTQSALESYNTNEYAMAARGYRSYSLFEHSITTGLLYGFYLVFTMTILVIYKEKIEIKKIAILTCILCIPGILMTKMRTGIFFVLLGVLLVFWDYPMKANRKKFFKIVMIVGVVMAALVPIISQYSDLIMSLFNQSKIEGSNTSWRLTQLQYISRIGQDSFLVGFGEKFRSLSNITVFRKYTGDFESVWFEQFLAHGIIGVLGYIILVYYTTLRLAKEYKSKYLFRFSITYWITYTMTSLPYFRTFLFYLILFYFIKKTDVYRRKNQRVERLKRMSIQKRI